MNNTHEIKDLIQNISDDFTDFRIFIPIFSSQIVSIKIAKLQLIENIFMHY